MNILVTDGVGYIGSHTIIELIASDHTVVVVDNLVNSSVEALHRVEQITRRDIPFYKVDIRDRAGMNAVLKHNPTITQVKLAYELNVPTSTIKYYVGKLSKAKLIKKVSFPLKMNIDARDSFTELLKTEKCGQFSVNISKPGITKGEHCKKAIYTNQFFPLKIKLAQSSGLNNLTRFFTLLPTT